MITDAGDTVSPKAPFHRCICEDSRMPDKDPKAVAQEILATCVPDCPCDEHGKPVAAAFPFDWSIIAPYLIKVLTPIGNIIIADGSEFAHKVITDVLAELQHGIVTP